MISFPLQAGQLGFTRPEIQVASYIDGTYSIDQTVASLSLAVPAAAIDGDLMLVILRTREDRSFTIPGGWATHASRAIATGMTGSNYTRVYIISKPRSGETSLTFTQSVSAACSGSLMLLRSGSVGGNALTDGLSSTITTIRPVSLLIAVGLNNGAAATTPANPTFSGFTQRGYAKWSSGGDHFYGAVCESRPSNAPIGSAVGTTMAWAGPTDQRAVWLAEVTSP